MRGAFSATPRRSAARRCGGAGDDRRRRRCATLFQVSRRQSAGGLDGRAALLRRLGAALDRAARDRSAHRRGRARLFDTLTARRAARTAVGAPDDPARAARGLGAIWLTGSALDGVPLGDAWRHPYAGGAGPTAGWVPFHKLSQWLAYSLFEPFEWAGVAVTDRDALTGLPEYRNGGLLLDTGVLALRQRRRRARRARRRQRARRRVARADGRAARRARTARARAARAARPAARLHSRGRHVGRGPRARAATCAAASRRLSQFAATAPYSRLRQSIRPGESRNHAVQRARVRSSARPAQAHAAAQEGNEHDQLPPAAERDRLR